MRRSMRLHALLVLAVLAGCSTRLQQDGALAQPTVAFPERWGQDEAGVDTGEAAAKEAEVEEAEAKEEKAPAEDGAAGPITHLCCETAKAGDKGSELTGCKVIEGGAAAQNACIEGGKTFKACEDAECGGASCRCSN